MTNMLEREALADELNGLFNAYLEQRNGIGKQAILDALWDNKASIIAALRAAERMDEVLRLLRKISDLAHDEDVGEPLDCAIDYANKAVAIAAGKETKS